MVVRNHAERSRQLHTYMRTNLEEIQGAEQTDTALTKIKARGEQRIERSKRRPRTSMVAAGYACRGANLRPKSDGPKGVLRCLAWWPRRECRLGQTCPIGTSLRCYSSNRFAHPRTFLPPYDATRFRSPFRMPHFSERFRDSKDRCIRP